MIAGKRSIEVTAREQKQEEKEAREDLQHYEDLIEYLDTHDTGDEIAGMPEVHFEINLPPRRKRYPLDVDLAAQLDSIAKQRGISAETLLNEWVREKTAESQAVGVTN